MVEVEDLKPKKLKRNSHILDRWTAAEKIHASRIPAGQVDKTFMSLSGFKVMSCVKMWRIVEKIYKGIAEEDAWRMCK